MPRVLATIVTWWALLGGVLVLLITAVTSLNVGAFILDRFGREFGIYIEGLPGYEDFVRLAISSAALMFFPYCQLKRGHVAVDIFVAGLSPALQRQLDRAWLLLTAAVAVFLGYWMVFGLLESQSDRVTTSILGWPEWPFYAPGAVSLVLWAAVAAAQLARPEGIDRGA